MPASMEEQHQHGATDRLERAVDALGCRSDGSAHEDPGAVKIKAQISANLSFHVPKAELRFPLAVALIIQW